MRFEYADARMPVATTKGVSTHYLTYEQVGSLRVIVDASGNVVERIDYDAFGNLGGIIGPAFEAVSVTGFQAAVRTGALVGAVRGTVLAASD
jgi:hypothetical protein